jgi:hypothetical protein
LFRFVSLLHLLSFVACRFVRLTHLSRRGLVLLARLDKILSTNVTVANDNKMVAFDAWVRDKYRNRPRPS